MRMLLKFSVSGASKMIIDRSVNLTIGYFASTLTRDTHMQPSSVYHSSNLIWVVPPGHSISSIEKLLFPFHATVWICFLFVLVCVMTAVFYIQTQVENIQKFVFGRGVHDPMLNIFNIIFGGSISIVPVGNFARTILMIFMIYCFIVQNAYKGGLFKFMQMSIREPIISTTDELITKGFNFVMFDSSIAYIKGMPRVLERTKFVSPTEFNRFMSESTNPDSKAAMLTSEDHLAYRNMKAYPHQYFYSTPETIYTNNLVIYFVKNSCFKARADQLISELLNGGFVIQWATTFIDKNLVKFKSTGAVALNMKKLEGCFQVLAACLLLSFVVFLFEIAVEKIKFWRKNSE